MQNSRSGASRLCFAGALVLAVGTLAVAVPPPAGAQGTSVEELERRLRRAKEERARREADAARAAAERKSQESRLATVVAQTDAPCTLSMNGDVLGLIPVGISKHRVSPGQKLVSCASSEEKTVFEGELDARSGQDTLLRIALAGKVAEIRSTRMAALEREARTRREAEAKALAEAARLTAERAERERETRRQQEAAERVAVMNKRFEDGAEGTLIDTHLGLVWTRSDNGVPVNWDESNRYCLGIGNGWTLPKTVQLQSLYEAALPGIPCGSYTCRTSDRFRLSNVWFWSADTNGSSQAWTVFMADGSRSSELISARGNGRAMCVRAAD